MCSIWIMTIILILGLCFGFGTVWFVKASTEGCFDCNGGSQHLKRNIGSWEILGNGKYVGTFNGKHWKTRDTRVFDTINWYLGRDIIVDVDDILNGRVIKPVDAEQSTTDTLMDKYDKFLNDIEGECK